MGSDARKKTKKDKQSQADIEIARGRAWARKVGRPTDKQQKLVYRWENAFLHPQNRADWTVPQCQEFVNFIWACYFGGNALAPAVTDGRGRACASANLHVVNLPRWARNRDIIIHEMAHAILNKGLGYKYSWEMEAHGPQFVRMHGELQGEFGRVRTSQFLREARKAGLRVAPSSAVPQPIVSWRDKPDYDRKERWIDRC